VGYRDEAWIGAQPRERRLQFHDEYGWRTLDVCFLQLSDRLVIISAQLLS
jgi:hypothetical protein